MTSIETATEVSTWSIDPAHSEVGFAVKHLMISTVRGHFADVQGTITVDETDPAQSSAEVIIDVSSIDTRSPDRDKHLRSADFFQVEKWPNITFRSRRIEGATFKENQRFRVIGDLTIRDVTKEVVLDATFEGRSLGMGKERAAFTATTKIDRRDFGLEWNQALEAGGVLVSNEVKISLAVQVVKE